MNKCCEHDKENKKALQAMDLMTGMAQKDKEIESAFCEGAKFERKKLKQDRQALLETIDGVVEDWLNRHGDDWENYGCFGDELKQKLKEAVK